MGEFLEGRLHPHTIFFLMRKIAVERMSGALTVHQGRINKKIFFLDGDPVYSSSNLATDGLGERLLLEGHLTLEDFERVTRQLRPGRRFGFILVELGLFSENEVKERLEEQVVAIYQSLFQATVGRFRFDKHVYANEDYQVLVPSVPQILRAARATNLERFQALLPGSAATVSPPVNQPPDAMDALLPAEKLLVEKIGRETLISDILQGLDRYDENLLRSLFAAVFSGFLDFDSEQESLSYETRVEEGEPAVGPAPPPAPAFEPAAAIQSNPPEIVPEPASATLSGPPKTIPEPASATLSGPPKIMEEPASPTQSVPSETIPEPASATQTQAIPPSEAPEVSLPSPEELAAESRAEELLRKAMALQKEGSQKEALDVLLKAVRKAPERLRNIYELTFSLVAFHAQKAQEGRQARASDAPLAPEEEVELVEQQKILPLDLRDLVLLDRQNWLLWAAGFSLVLVLAILVGAMILSPPALLPSPSSTDTVEVVLLYFLVFLLAAATVSCLVLVIRKQRAINRKRKLIFTTIVEAKVFAELLPRDPTTKLLNRKALPEVLEREVARADWTFTPLSFVLSGILNFEKLNVREGNLGGHNLVNEVAELLQETARKNDFVVRYESDQFLAVLPGTPENGTGMFIERVRQALELKNIKPSLSLEFGTGTYVSGMEVKAVLGAAEVALNQAREAARIEAASQAKLADSSSESQ